MWPFLFFQWLEWYNAWSSQSLLTECVTCLPPRCNSHSTLAHNNSCGLSHNKNIGQGRRAASTRRHPESAVRASAIRVTHGSQRARPIHQRYTLRFYLTYVALPQIHIHKVTSFPFASSMPTLLYLTRLTNISTPVRDLSDPAQRRVDGDTIHCVHQALAYIEYVRSRMVELLPEAVCKSVGYGGVSETHGHTRFSNLLLLRVFRVEESRPEPL